MLFFHDFADIKNLPLTVISPPSAARSQGTLNAIAGDLWDYHLDHKRWWQQSNNRVPFPVIPPRYGRAFPRLHIKAVRTIFRQITNQHTLSVAYALPPTVIIQPDNTQSGWPPGTSGAYFEDLSGDPGEQFIQISLSPFGGAPPDPNPPPPVGSYKIYWHTRRGRGHFDIGGGGLVSEEAAVDRYGSFNIQNTEYNMGPSPGFTQVTIRDEFISDHKVARLNYLSFVDVDVIRKGETPTPGSDEFKSSKSQVVSGVLFISQFNVPLGFTGAQTYLFPARGDIRPACIRPFPNNQSQRDWRTYGDIWGIELDAPAGFGRLGFLVGTPEFTAGSHMTFIDDPHPGGVDLWNGIAHVVTNSVLNSLDSDGGFVLFGDFVETYSITQNMNVKLTEEPAP